MAGYSGTPLLQKLGIKDGQVIVALNAPEGVVPDKLRFRTRLPAHADVVWLFTTKRAALESKLDAIGKAIFPDGMLWISWPKKASKMPTDITEDVLRDVVLPLGLVDVKVCAVDDVWSGLKIVWRKENRDAHS